MVQTSLSRRAFFKETGVTALAGAVAARAGSAPTAPQPARHDFDTIYDRVGTHCTKWDTQIATFGGGSIEVGMGIADMDFRAPPCVTRALSARCRHENWGYGYPEDELIAAIVAWDATHYGLEIDPASLQLSSGIHCELIAAIRAFAPPGTRVLLTPPIYGSFYTDIELAHTLPEESPLEFSDGRYSIDWHDLESRMTGDTRVFILCNPHNPTGNCWSKDDLMRLGQLCLENGVVVFADEIHRDFVSKGHRFTPFASLPDKKVVDNSVTFTSANKSFNLAALRTGWFFSTNAGHVERVMAYHRKDTNALGIAASIAALTEGEEWLDDVVSYIDGNLDRVASRVREIPHLKSVKAEGTYLAWIDVSELIDRVGAKGTATGRTKAQDASRPPITPTMVLEQWFVENAKVHLYPGSMFSTGGEGHLRMNVATSRKLLDRALDNIAAAVAKV